MNIGSGTGYPSASLSNFAPHYFVIDGVECSSMEGFLQSLKFSNPDMQVHVCTLVGKKAKFKGKKKKWWVSQSLWWRGVEIDRHSQEYQDLLDRAFSSLAINRKFKAAIIAAGDANFTHSIGKTNANQTILTVREFCGRLTKIRDRFQRESNANKLFGS